MYNIIIYGDVGKYPWVDLEVLGVYTPVWTHLGPPPGPPIWTHLGPPPGPPIYLRSPFQGYPPGTPYLDPSGTRFQTPSRVRNRSKTGQIS